MNTKLTYLFLLAILICPHGVFAQNKGKNTISKKNVTVQKQVIKETDGYKWIKTKKGKLFGVSTPKGKVIVPTKYSDVKYEKISFENGNVRLWKLYSENSGVGFKSEDGDGFEPIYGYTEVTFPKSPTNQSYYAQVYKGPYVGIRVEDEIISPDQGYTQCEVKLVKNDNNIKYIRVKKGLYMGLYNIAGKELIKPELKLLSCSIEKNNKDYYVVGRKEGYGEGIYDLSGSEIISPQRMYFAVFPSFTSTSDSLTYFSVSRGGHFGICDWTGKEIVSPDMGYDFCVLEGENKQYFVKCNKGDVYAMYSMSGKEVIPIKRGYTYCYYKDGYICIQKGDYYGICNIKGKELVSINKKYTLCAGPYKKSNGEVYVDAYKGDKEKRIVLERAPREPVDPRIGEAIGMAILNMTQSLMYLNSGYNMGYSTSGNTIYNSNVYPNTSISPSSASSYDNNSTRESLSEKNKQYWEDKKNQPCSHCYGSGRCHNCSNGYTVVKIGAPKTRCVACPTTPGVCEYCHGTGKKNHI